MRAPDFWKLPDSPTCPDVKKSGHCGQAFGTVDLLESLASVCGPRKAAPMCRLQDASDIGVPSKTH